ncbi:EamA family transporter RarD [uncultured Roseovarius sp.]|uniref:EamA family transporter RarD n=1 Tax=uncultured Roseovarius sp. TaxID=293344 RepID=UPI002619C0AA|nr:EamA family transporter RarD [uncultured Roseovarius sp.]
MSEAAKGVWAMVVACTIWGLSPLYYKLLEHLSPIEILAHRTLWSFVLFAILLLFQGRIGQIAVALGSFRSVLIIGCAAFFISLNWFVYISSIQIDMVLEASLGYFIFPLIAVVLGAVVLGERMARAQVFAVFLAFCAVLLLALGFGVTPWIALVLGTSLGLYGLIKKGLSAGPVVSVTAEVLLLSPIAIGVLWWIHAGGSGAFGTTLPDTILLIFSGVLTAWPLILFSYATKRASLGTVGLVQYLNPSLQFLVATVIFLEPLSYWHVMSFAMIWAALVIYSASALRQDRALRKAPESSLTDPTT